MNNNQLLAHGIQALKDGQREEARQVLMQVVEQDEKNERAWLWLSGAVNTNEDRRICLENVLTINPNNATARKGLAKLDPDPAKTNPEPLISPPENTYQSDFQETDWTHSTAPQTNAPKEYDDVWSTSENICAFCAHPVSQTDKRCPKCNHKLTTKILSEPVPSKHYRILRLVFIVQSVIQLLVTIIIVGMIFTVSLTDNWSIALIPLVSTFFTTIFTIGIYFRQPWAYWLLVALQILQIIGMFFNLAVSAAVSPPPSNPSPFLNLLCLSPFILFQLFIYYTIFMAGADFHRVTVRQIASVNDRPKTAVQYARLAKALSKKGLWASAILHWQRAIGRSSGHARYHLDLAQAYARLGFYQRGLDSLATAQEKTKSDEVRQNIQKEKVRIQKKLEKQGLIT